MSDETEIPLLEDLIQKGQVDQDHDLQSTAQIFDEFTDIEIEPDEPEESTETSPIEKPGIESAADDDLDDDTSIRELLIDEEIRSILDKHMDNAYQEIIRLLNHKIT